MLNNRYHVTSVGFLLQYNNLQDKFAFINSDA